MNAVQVFGYQVNNGVPILSWYDDMADRELVNILPFIRDLAGARDVRPLIAQHSSLHRCPRIVASHAKEDHPGPDPGSVACLSGSFCEAVAVLLDLQSPLSATSVMLICLPQTYNFSEAAHLLLVLTWAQDESSAQHFSVRV